MKLKDKVTCLDYFQRNAIKTYASLGFTNDISNVIFGIIIGMRNLVVAAEQQDTILLHKHMGTCAWYIANYATINNLKIAVIIGGSTYEEMEEETNEIDLELFLQHIKDDISFVKTMSYELKIQFIHKCWISLFPSYYDNDFIKIDRILKTNIQDNKIKYPEQFVKKPV
jgi:ABC-type transport system involved in Fe-S cluster assembly fused permease/ATPase subunit